MPSFGGTWRSEITSGPIPQDAKIYGDLKRALASQFREDRPGYINAKGEFVEELTSPGDSPHRRVVSSLKIFPLDKLKHLF